MARRASKEVKPWMLPCRFTAFFDGCCEPVNPGGTAGYGAVIFDGRERVWENSGLIPAAPTTSNNVAEYLGVNLIFDWLLEHGGTESAQIFGDNRMVICQLWGWPVIGKRWKIHGVDSAQPKGFYADTAVLAREKLKRLPRCTGYWIPRDENSIADKLSKSHLIKAGIEFRIQPESAEEATQ